tara:strand:- start:17878 stop:19380 length:1503 start_codon:yes stop_codon:yes gene_type:complete
MYMKPMGVVGAVMLLWCTLILAGCHEVQTDIHSETAPPEKSGSEESGPEKAKNVILFIGDGMGVSTVTAIRILDGQRKGLAGEENVLSWEKFPHLALAKTYNTNQQVPDSAGTATAMVTGHKTKAGLISVSAQVTRGACASAKDQRLQTLLERAERAGLSTGVVTTARLTHATPAALYAHVPERDWEADSDMPAEALAQGCRDIARQLIEFSEGDGIEVALGGGRRAFFPQYMKDPETGAPGRRRDGRNLIEEWLDKHKGGRYVWRAEDFRAISPEDTDRLLGLFNASHMQYEAQRSRDQGGEPSLAEMTEKAIRILEKNDAGYFLMVEAGRVDHGHHAGSAYLALHDGIALNQAVEQAVRMTNPDDTLIIVTADHSHTFVMAGYPTRGNPILGKVVGNDDRGSPETVPALAADGKPYTTLGYYMTPQGLRQGEDRADLGPVDTEAPEFRQQALIPVRTGHHAGEDVAIYATGPGAAKVQGVMEQNKIFDVMIKALNLPL